MGIRRKILIGCISIGVLLLLSGIISTLELVGFNRSTHKLLELNRKNIELSKDMLNAVQEQNTALLMNIVDSIHTRHDSILLESKSQFDTAYQRAITIFVDSPNLKLLKEANDNYTTIISEITDTTTIEWFSKIYKTSYYNLTNVIKDFMVDTQQKIIEYTADLERIAYRATMVGIIALAAGLLLVIMFYYMINSFILSPIISMQNSLHRHLELKTPFDVHIETKDEISMLRDDIITLVEKTKK